MHGLTEGDPIRMITIALFAVVAVNSVISLKERRGEPAVHWFVLSWCAHNLIFYASYYFSGRFDLEPEVRQLVAWWPPALRLQAAISLFALQWAAWLRRRGRI